MLAPSLSERDERESERVSSKKRRVLGKGTPRLKDYSATYGRSAMKRARLIAWSILRWCDAGIPVRRLPITRACGVKNCLRYGTSL